MKSTKPRPLVAALLIVVLGAILMPLLLREDGVVSQPLDMTLPPVPEIPQRDGLPPVSNDEMAAAEAEINAAREQLHNGTDTAEDADAPLKTLPVPQAWGVEVAVIATEEQARQQKQQLLDQGYSAYLRQLPDDAGWQLLAGPELKYSAAEETQARLKFDPKWQIEARIVPFSP
jgi:cell division septation protein DedD